MNSGEYEENEEHGRVGELKLVNKNMKNMVEL